MFFVTQSYRRSINRGYFRQKILAINFGGAGLRGYYCVTFVYRRYFSIVYIHEGQDYRTVHVTSGDCGDQPPPAQRLGTSEFTDS